MMNKDIEAILVVAGDDLYKLDIVSENLFKFTNISMISIITNAPNEAKEILPETKKIRILDEKKILSPLSKNLLSQYQAPGFPQRYFWYYQQFLKMSYAFYCESDYYLIWDADTILTREISFFENGIPLYTEGKEKLNYEYANTYEKIFNKKYLSQKSYIAQHMVINKNIMIKMIDELGGLQSLQHTILSNLSGKTNSQYSEYESYFNYLLSLELPYKIIKRNWFRYGASLFGFKPNKTDISKLSKYYDYVAFEKFDRGLIKKIRAYLMHYYSILKGKK
ncbi:hypothetical protein JK226_16440 [Providencia rettgeri]|nr:hypothetical protein [Providencia rettgeri]MBS0874968.1 hypothetical protein [Providencia rettgeri]MBS0921892.1 hypothetical protein [Providencia rettgeri]